jgi:cytochrome c-type biogenesis protein CcmE
MKTPVILAVGLIVASALGYIAFSSVGENLVYYWTPTEMKDAGDKARGANIRLGGMVVAGSIQAGSTPLRFKVTDNTTTVDVSTSAVPPQMFREGIGVVLEGTVGDDGQFSSNRLMVKHDEQYKAPTPGDTPDKAKMFQVAEVE